MLDKGKTLKEEDYVFETKEKQKARSNKGEFVFPRIHINRIRLGNDDT